MVETFDLRTLRYLTEIICKIDRESFSIKHSLETKLSADLWNIAAQGDNEKAHPYLITMRTFNVKLQGSVILCSIKDASKQQAKQLEGVYFSNMRAGIDCIDVSWLTVKARVVSI